MTSTAKKTPKSFVCAGGGQVSQWRSSSEQKRRQKQKKKKGHSSFSLSPETIRKTKKENPISLSPEPSFTVSFCRPSCMPVKRQRASRSTSRVRFSQEVDVYLIQEWVEDDWFKDVSKFLPASASEEVEASENEDSYFETFLKGTSSSSSSNIISERDDSCKAARGFHNTDVVLIEAKQGNNAFLGSGVLLQNPSTWGNADKSGRRFVVTAGHCVCSIEFDGWSSFKVKKYKDIRLRVPIKPWQDFTEDCDRYCHDAFEMKRYFSNIIVEPRHIFVHPKYKGNWDQHKWMSANFCDVALIAIPAVTPSIGATMFNIWQPRARLQSMSVVGFPMATEKEFEVGNQVYLINLVWDKDLNEQKAIVIELPNEKGEYLVKLRKSGEKVRAQAKNLRHKDKKEKLLSYIPYVSTTRVCADDDNFRPEFKKNFTMAQYYCRNFHGMSGGGLLFDDNIVGIHTGSNLKYMDDCGNGLIFTLKLQKWMKQIYSKWEHFELGVHQFDNGLSPGLNDACKNLDVRRVKELLLQGANPSWRDKRGRSPVWICSYFSTTEAYACLRLLKDNGADVSLPDKEGRTPVYSAAFRGNIDFLKHLLHMNADLSTPDNHGETPLIAAAFNGKIQCLEFLVHMNANLSTPDQNGETPVSAAAFNGNFDCLKFLAEANANLMTQNKNGATPAYAASFKGNIDCLKLLAQMKADLTTTNKNGESPVAPAAFNGDLECLKFLVEAKADLAQQDKNGETPVSAAAFNGNIDCLKYLARMKADLTTPNKHGATPLYAAAFKGNLDCLKFLAQMKADPSKLRDVGLSPVAAAAFKGNIDCLKFLIEMKADFTSRDKNGSTPFYAAAQNGNIRCLKYLAKMNANLTIPNNLGATPVAAAAFNGNLKCLKFLARMGADLTTSTHKGETPTYFAAKKGRVDCLMFLAHQGVNLTGAWNAPTKITSPAYPAFIDDYINSFAIGEEILFKANMEDEYEIGYIGNLRPLKVYQKGWTFSYYRKYVKKKETPKRNEYSI